MRTQIISTLFLLKAICALAQVDSLSAIDSSQFQLQFNSSEALVTAEGLEEQDISPLLQASRDVYAQFAGFQFSALRFRLRGLPANYSTAGINGICMNAADSRLLAFSGWSGLGDVIRFPETSSGLSFNRSYYSGSASNLSFESHAAMFKKGTRYSYTVGNRSFSQRATASVFSGLTKNNWAFALALSLRNGNEVYVAGTSMRAASVYLSIEKIISTQHAISITGIFAPQAQDRASAATAEVYDLTQSNYYNSNWGYQVQQVRSASQSKQLQPLFFLTDNFSTPNNIKIQSSASYKFGKQSFSALNWSDAANPDPDYYRYLPSYYYLQQNNSAGDALANDWRQNPLAHQINWDNLIQQNKANLFSVNGAGYNTSESRSRYIVEDRCENNQVLILQSAVSKRVRRHFLYTTLRADYSNIHYFEQVNDLLGGSFWLDINQFAAELGMDESIKQNNIDAPNRKVRAGDNFGYDYKLLNKDVLVFLGDDYHGSKWDAYINSEFKALQVQRSGLVANGRFPSNSKGKSEAVNFLLFKCKGGLDYKINGRQTITLRSELGTQAPDTRQVFVSAASRNDLIPTPQSEKIFLTDINYHVHYAFIRARLSAYANWQRNLMQMRSYWHDSYNTTVNMLLQNVGQRQLGLEFGMECTFKIAHVIQFAAGIGSFTYDRNAKMQAWNDNTAIQIQTLQTTYIKGLHTATSPESALGLSYRYNAKRYWYASCQLNYVAGRYVAINPDKRSEQVIARYTIADTELLKQVLQQEKLHNAYYVNAMAGKSYRFKKKYNVNLSLSINNLLNTKSIIASGYEQLRFDASEPSRFANKYLYVQGFNMMFQASINF